MDTAAIEIRPATVEDAKGIQTCLAAAFEPYRAEYSPGAYADTVLNDEALLRRLQQMHVLVAAVEGNVVGTITGTPKGHLRGMAVLPEWRGSGIAAKLSRQLKLISMLKVASGLRSIPRCPWIAPGNSMRRMDTLAPATSVTSSVWH